MRAQFLSSLTARELEALQYDWSFWARDNQIAPAIAFSVWLLLAGRGFGKTRTGAEWVRHRVESEGARYLGLVARTPADARDVMVEGESGILKISDPHFMPVYEPSKRRLEWPNGAWARIFSSWQPAELRGPQFDTVWADEFCYWKYRREAWDNIQLATRLPHLDPKICITTTPRNVAELKEILADDNSNGMGTVVTKGRTLDNRANLHPKALHKMLRLYGGTILGKQELDGELVEDVDGALWNTNVIAAQTVREGPPRYKRIIIAVDPAVSTGKRSAETGIIVHGLGIDDRAYVLADLSGQYEPEQWGQIVVTAYWQYEADAVIGEVNNGGDLVRANVHAIDRRINFKAVRASRGKQARAEPVATLYRIDKIRHVGSHPELEDQMRTWIPGETDESPDRIDANVWGCTELLLGEGAEHRPALIGPAWDD